MNILAAGHVEKILAFNFSNAKIIYVNKRRGECYNPGSSSGRTKDSGSFNGGSNPSPGVFKNGCPQSFFYLSA